MTRVVETACRGRIWQWRTFGAGNAICDRGRKVLRPYWLGRVMLGLDVVVVNRKRYTHDRKKSVDFALVDANHKFPRLAFKHGNAPIHSVVLAQAYIIIYKEGGAMTERGNFAVGFAQHRNYCEFCSEIEKNAVSSNINCH